MIRAVTVWILTATAAAFIPATGVQSVKEDTKSSAQSFIEKAAEGQQVEIILGQLAAERAGDEQVKQFGAQMAEDHQKANQEIEQLASKEGVQLPMHLTGKHKNKKEKISQLSGKEFDRAYMTYMLRDHAKDVQEFERGAHALKNPQIQQWAEGTLPVLKQHLQKARQIASSIGIDLKPAR
jgi:putative membrane protein